MTIIAVLPGDGIGPEITAQTVRVLNALRARDFSFDLVEAPVGLAAYLEHGHPLPESTLALAREADAVLFGPVGDPRYDHLDRELRPDSAIGGLRQGLGLFASLRQISITPDLATMSPLSPEAVAGLDLVIVRELGGDVYFGTPRGQRACPDGPFAGEPEGFDTMRYSESEVRRIARIAFETARARGRRLCNADKANVLETSRLWRRVVDSVAHDYADVELTHMYVDNVAMRLVTEPKHFDVILTANLFGDILADIASALTGSVGLPASAMFSVSGKGLYEAGHGSAPDIAGRDVANPLASIRSAALMLQHSLKRPDLAARTEGAIQRVLGRGLRTDDIHQTGTTRVGTREMGDAVVAELGRDPS